MLKALRAETTLLIHEGRCKSSESMASLQATKSHYLENLIYRFAADRHIAGFVPAGVSVTSFDAYLTSCISACVSGEGDGVAWVYRRESNCCTPGRD